MDPGRGAMQAPSSGSVAAEVFDYEAAPARWENCGRLTWQRTGLNGKRAAPRRAGW